VVTLLSTIVTLNDFNIVYIMTRGGPARHPHLATLQLRARIMSQRWGLAMAASLRLAAALVALPSWRSCGTGTGRRSDDAPGDARALDRARGIVLIVLRARMLGLCLKRMAPDP